MLDAVTENLNSSQLRELKEFGGKLNRFGVNFAVFSADGELVLLCDDGKFKSSRERLEEISLQAFERNNERSFAGADGGVYRLGQEGVVLAAVLKVASASRGFAALIDLCDMCWADTGRLKQFCSQQNVSYEQLAEVMRCSVEEDSECFTEMLELFARNFQTKVATEEQIGIVSTELAQTYEELVLLHKMSANMKVTESDANFLQMACDSLTEIVSVEGIAVLLEKTVDGGKQLVLSAGSGLIDIDEDMMGILHDRLVAEINNGREALLDSEVDSPFKYKWSENIANIIAVPLYGKDRGEAHSGGKLRNGNSIIGVMVAINRIDKPDFDSTDVKLFDSVANGGCAVFIENGRLFKDLQELFIGSLKALTSSIDAKDKYTRGHSERVAFISRWIAERLAEHELLEEKQIHRTYLAGLLHDIGKVGIDERVLRKEGKLTEAEFGHIRSHPSVGAGILSGIKQMRDIVPGVLCHHERIDGKGYPNGLSGEDIPLIGRIIALADSFDAMTSKRTYRDAMSIDETLAEMERGLGTQFDEKIGRIFLNSDTDYLWSIVQDGFIEGYGSSSFSEYGATAVGTLIR